MTTEQIEKFFSLNNQAEVPVKISFKTRNNVTGIFIHTPDFDELKAKNFYRIVSEANFKQWKQTKDFSLCRMFNGAEFTKLAIA
jgi:hypothetical protein